MVLAVEPAFGPPVRPAVYGVLAFWLGCAIVFERGLQRVRVREVGDRWRTAMLAADIVLMTLARYESEATRWFGESGYLIVVVIAAGALSLRSTVWLTAFASLSYGVLLYAQRTSLALSATGVGSLLHQAAERASLGAWALGTVLLILFAVLVRASSHCSNGAKHGIG